MEREDRLEIDFCTLGMFIIDDIKFPPPTEPVRDILGGAGSWSALGARLFSPPPLSQAVGWIVDAGSDFPDELRDTIRSWETSCVIRETPERKTTRGLNVYGPNEERAFKYVEPKLRIDANALPATHLLAKSFHLICNPSRCIDLVTDILARRETLVREDPRISGSSSAPLFIWEPVPDKCTPDEKENMYQALNYIQVLSPNYAELSGFYGFQPSQDGEVNRETLGSMCDDIILNGFSAKEQGVVVVRAGKHGCYVASGRLRRWYPAYHRSPQGPHAAPNPKVVDPTGGGNAFLGGLAIGLVRSKADSIAERLEGAAAHGSVAASFAIEQVGMPILSRSDGTEFWNSESVAQRLREYRGHLQSLV